jgi:5-methyltetrahydrofolate--homocysteine methyltransferase
VAPDRATLVKAFVTFENAPLPVSVLPNAGLPSVVEGKMHYDETPETFTSQIIHFANDFGVNIVGGCCGTTPAHLKLVVEAMQRVTPKRRDAKLVAAAASIYFQQPYVQDASFLIVGERVNASGSKKMRDLLNAEDWDGLVSLAKEQEREGARADVNVDCVGRDGEKTCTSWRRGDERKIYDVRLDRMAEDGSGPAARGRQVHSEFDEL